MLASLQNLSRLLLDARLHQDRAQNEQERQGILAAELHWLNPQNGRRFGIETVYLFGSET